MAASFDGFAPAALRRMMLRQDARPMRWTNVFTGCARSSVFAILFVAVGAGAAGISVAWVPRGNQDTARGALIYASACAGCHGTELQGQTGWRPSPEHAIVPPPLDANGHAWRHSDAELVALVSRGTAGTNERATTLGMPGFTESLSPDEIDAVLAFVKSNWPANLRAYQASLKADDGDIFATLLREVGGTLAAVCQAPAVPGGTP